MSDIDRSIDAAIRAGHAALDRIRSMRRSLDRADAAQRLAREMRGLSEEAAAVQHAEVLLTYDAEGLSFAELAERFGISKTLAHKIVRTRDRARANQGEDMTEPSTAPEPPAVVAAIVTSDAGILIARRNDGKPLWTFISGENEPGESPADTAVREVKEEAGLRIRAGGVIGRRIHPRTGRLMVYVSAQTTHGNDAFVGDTDELAEVKWVTPEEADDLTGGTIFEPVRQHIRHMLKNGNGASAHEA